MLKKMLLQVLAAAVLVGGAAAVYAQAKDNGYLSAPAQTKAPEVPASAAGKEVRKGEDDRKHVGREQARAKDQDRHNDDD